MPAPHPLTMVWMLSSSTGLLQLLLSAKDFMMALASGLCGKVQQQLLHRMLQPAIEWIHLLGDMAHLLQSSGTIVAEDVFLDIIAASEAGLKVLQAAAAGLGKTQPAAGGHHEDVPAGV